VSAPAAVAVRRLFTALHERQRQPGMLAKAMILHLLAWLIGIGETWLALHAMGHPGGFARTRGTVGG
jgi:hypothetical protein